MSFDAAFQKIVMVEGGYSNHPSDTGGETQFGITKAVARANGYTGDMRDLPLETAKAIYRALYWDALRLTEIDALCPAVAHELFDTGVNMGVGVAAKFLQRALNVFNRMGADYADLIPDGALGPKTVAALKALLAKRGKNGELVLVRALNALQGARYIEISESRTENESFTFGWFLNRVSL